MEFFWLRLAPAGLRAPWCDLAESSRQIDMITLIEELDRHKDLQPIGDVGYVSSLTDGVPDRRALSTTSRLCATRRCCAG